MAFENTKVEVITLNGQPMFELYSTGMALGQTKTAKGKTYPRKDRINENVKSAEITPVVRNGQQYITEPQLYDLMLEIKTEKVKPFRKWVTDEVLPSIHKTGSYSVEQPTPTKPYGYFDKYYKGTPVLTIADITHFTEIRKGSIQYILTEQCTKGIDWLVLESEELAEFKKANPKVNKDISHLLVVFKSGFDKLAKVAGLTSDVECFKAIEAPVKVEEPPKWLYVDVDNSRELKEQIKAARKHIDTFDTILSKLEKRSVEEKEFKYITHTIACLSIDLSIALAKINTKEYTTTPQYIAG